MAGRAMMALLLLVLLAAASGDFLSSCPAMCKCKWSSGKQTADCSNSGLTAIPLEIHHDVQVFMTNELSDFFPPLYPYLLVIASGV